MILGLHCSVRKGYAAALEEGVRHDCRAIQILPYRRHDDPSPGDLAAFRDAWRATVVSRVIAHARFVPFLASSDDARHRHSREHLTRELRLSVALGAAGFVLHAGAHSVGQELKDGMARFADGVAVAWKESGCGVEIILENVPGGGRRMGGTLEELSELGELLAQRGIRTAFCLDTAHAWAQGYDLTGSEGMWRFIGRANRLLGAERIKVFHLNDTRALLGSHREDHWHWGQGHLGTEGLAFLLAREEFKDAAGILETPKDSDGENMALVRSLAKA
ncbi:MAG: deoxyribonuclease IV [Elusimicrobia bacterium]|nr:deoxyribonuclease IV [Elusimicrobiota bacterium]